MISKAINKIIPTDISCLIAEYIKPDKLDANIQNEIKSEFVYRLFKNQYDEFIGEVNEFNKKKEKFGEGIEEPFTPFMFEYLIDCMPHEDFNFYIECLKNHKEKTECEYFIKVIETVIGWEQRNLYYDDGDYRDYINSHYPIIFADYEPRYEYDEDYYMDSYYDDASDI